ncbi:MAG: glycosyltransferase involved in cell wall biosynthesis [Saprospiraceae bacterium]|jgi:glycosyltransferase involved in cell wall biosynthesis
MNEEGKTIAVVINTSWNIYNFRIGLLQALQEEGYSVVAIAPRDGYSEKLQAFGFEFHNVDINNKGTNPIEDTKLIWSFYKLYKRVNPDVLLHYTIKPNIYGTVAARIAGIPVISNISGLGTVFLNQGISSRIAKLLYKVALQFPAKVFFQNAEDRALFIDSKLVAENKTDLLPGSGIDTLKFSPIESDNDSTVDTFLFIARLVKDKGLVEYVDAARIVKGKYPDVVFKVLGAFYPGNPTAITQEEMAAWEHEGVITYLGTSNEVPSLIAAADCVVLPSYREGLSRVLLEAASMATPIITTDVPGCRDVVDNEGNGFLCKVKDARDLAVQMEKMIKLEQVQRVEMGLKGREKVVKEFDEAIVINQYQDAISDIFAV